MESLKTLLSIPQLEHLDCNLYDCFPHTELPELKHLSELNIKFHDKHPHFERFFEAVKRSRSLEKIRMDFYPSLNEDTLINLVCGIVEAATSIRKEVFVVLSDVTIHLNFGRNSVS